MSGYLDQIADFASLGIFIWRCYDYEFRFLVAEVSEVVGVGIQISRTSS